VAETLGTYGYRSLDGDRPPHYGKMGAPLAAWLSDVPCLRLSDRQREQIRLLLLCVAHLIDSGEDEPPAFCMGYETLGNEAGTSKRRAEGFVRRMAEAGLIVDLGPADGGGIWRTFAPLQEAFEASRESRQQVSPKQVNTGRVIPKTAQYGEDHPQNTGKRGYPDGEEEPSPKQAKTGIVVSPKQGNTGIHKNKEDRMAGSALDVPAGRPRYDDGTLGAVSESEPF
jgi:hypothetical protein